MQTASFLAPQVHAVITRLYETRRYPADNTEGWRHERRDPHKYKDFGYPISLDQGKFMYLLCRAMRATRVVEFATSFGMSTLHFAAAVRDNGGGIVIGSELVPEKVAVARRNLAEAGLADLVDIRQGDARETLRNLGGPVDFALIDGWPQGEPSLARAVFETVAPQLRVGGMAMNDNGEEDYLAFVRNPANGFVSMSLPISSPTKGPTELTVKIF